MKTPLYRAKKIDSDEYVIGYLHKSLFENITINDNELMYAIDPLTLSISFENMKDSEGTRIFASLSENGKGGDKFSWNNEAFVIWFDNQGLTINTTNEGNFDCNCHDTLQEWFCNKYKAYDLKVIGIQE